MFLDKALGKHFNTASSCTGDIEELLPTVDHGKQGGVFVLWRHRTASPSKSFAPFAIQSMPPELQINKWVPPERSRKPLQISVFTELKINVIHFAT